MKITLTAWRQAGPHAAGSFETYEIPDVDPDMSFLEMLDILNDQLTLEGREPIAFDHDCREGICGSCGFLIDGVPHGPQRATATCQLHMRHYKDGDHITIEPFRAQGFPIVKDLAVNRQSLDKIIEAGGYISVNAGSAPDANMIPVPRPTQELAMDAAACIQCGACVAACPNGAAQLFTSAKLAHLNVLPQGQPERYQRAASMVEQMEELDFGSCTNMGECAAVCPAEISLDFIALLNKDYIKSKFVNREP